MEKGASQVSGRGRVSRVARADQGKLSGKRCLPGCSIPRGLCACPLLPGAGVALEVQAGRPPVLVAGGPLGCRAVASASLESVKAPDVHSCSRLRCPGQQDGASSRCPSPLHSSGPRGAQDHVGRLWSVGYGPQGHPRSPGGATVPGATCGLRAPVLLPGLKVEREMMLMVQGAV